MSCSRKMLMSVGVVVTSCYIFPFVLAAFPVANSKMILAAIGIALYAFNIFRNRDSSDLDKSFVNITLWGLGVSLIAWMATVVNNTHDYTYATYIVSMWVWIGGAYTVSRYIKWVHGEVSVRLMANYLLVVCVAQCGLALLFDWSATALEWRMNTFAGEAYMGATDEDRLSGIGCALDVAGLRFSAVMIMASVMALKAASGGNNRLAMLYIGAMMFMVTVGSMISRTTVVGGAIAIAYMVLELFLGNRVGDRKGLAGNLFTLMVVAVVASTVLYNTNDKFRDNLRFGFEGFFSLAEKGEWQTHSNDILKSMVVWPDNAKTWIIGDGYIENPNDTRLESYDQYYVGPSFHGYYMQTDIGYCRFIFYFGLTGLIVFCLYFFTVSNVLASRFPQYKWMFYLILLMNFIGWCKVSSDLFMVFAPFLCISAREESEAEENEAEESEE